jgi:hypothetical protein
MSGRVAIVAIGLGATLASGSAQERGGFVQQNTAENLRQLMATVHRRLHVEKSVADGAALFRSLVPDEARVKRALRDDAPADTWQRIVQAFAALSKARDAEFLGLMQPQQSVVRVRGATTEEIAAYREGSIPFEHFPSATQQVARELLRPGVTFYEVEFLQPGQPRGIKYHLFYWDGERWAMLGPAWRSVR